MDSPYAVNRARGLSIFGWLLWLALMARCLTLPVRAQIIGGVVVKQAVNLNGNNFLADSYNSQDPAKSTNGQYDPAKYSGDYGSVIALGQSISQAIEFGGSVQIYGKVYTGPGCSVEVGPNGAVGEHSWQASHVGIEPGWLRQDAQFAFPDTTPPAEASLWGPSTSGTVVLTNVVILTTTTNSGVYPNPTPPSGVTTNVTWLYNTTVTPPTPAPPGTTTNTTANAISSVYPLIGVAGGAMPGSVTWDPTHNSYHFTRINSFSFPVYTYSYNLYATNSVLTTNYYDHILYADHQYLESSLLGKTLVLVPIGINNPATVYLPNGLTGNEDITIQSGAKLVVYAGGATCGIAGNNIVNDNGNADSFTVLCSPTVTNLALSGNGRFTGVLLAPNANFTLNGGGNQLVDFCGAVMASWLTLNGHFAFHYDEALASFTGLTSPPQIVSAPQDQTVLAGQNSSFSVLAGGTALYYQWQFNGTNLLNATNDTLTLPQVQLGDAGSYRVVVSSAYGAYTNGLGVVTNTYGSITSAPVVLTVASTPVGTLHPLSTLSSNHFQFVLTGLSNGRYRVEGSTNFVDWLPLATNLVPFTFSDTQGTNLGQRFYRSVYVP